MKKLLLSSFAVLIYGFTVAQDCTPLMDMGATTPGMNPVSLQGSVAGVPYDEVNTIVIPAEVATGFPPPNDTMDLCNLTINDVIGMPVGYNYEVWAFHNGGAGSQYNVLAQTVDTVHIFVPLTRICIRLTHPSPPASTDMGDGMPDRDTVYVRVAVEGWLDLGIGCNPLGSLGRDTFEIGLPIKDAVYAGVDDNQLNSFSVLNAIPNPANDFTMINFNTPTAGEVSVTMFDALGKMIRSNRFNSVAGINKYPVDLTEMRSGIYIYNITYNGKTISKKLIVNK